MKIYTKEELIIKLIKLREKGWIKNGRFGNQGGIGNTLEDYPGIQENNLPIPNAAEWELKTQRLNSSSLTTLFHFEPSPRALKLVSTILLPKYGWSHKEAGKKYSEEEVSFRQTINGKTYTDRGFSIMVDRKNGKVLVTFDKTKVSSKHQGWLKDVKSKVGLKELNPQPYWGFDDLEHKAGTKLLNCFYVQADVKTANDNEYYWYKQISMLKQFNFKAFLVGLEKGYILVDFDARTGHNHGTKFRLKQNYFKKLYKESKDL